MQYRQFGKLGWKVSALSFGTMRLPLNSTNQADINEREAIKLIRYAIDEGVNYLDTAYVYHEGNSEAVVGKALENGYRNKVKIATKLPVFSVRDKADLDKIFDNQLKKLKAKHIDFYLLHSLMNSTWKKVQEFNIIKWAENKIKEGKIGYLGFSFHDEYELFREILDIFDWSFCQIQYNYLDEHFQAGKVGLRYAAQKGLAVIIMEPLAGGLLAVKPPKEIQQEWDKTGIKRTPADWALQWVWNHPEVATALSGMNSKMQLQENLESANNSGPNTLSKIEMDALSKSRELFQKCGYIGCSKCYYCSNCSQGIDIPVTLEFLNRYAAKRRDPTEQEKIKQQYATVVPVERRANNCIHCGQCEKVCPQHLPVGKLLTEATTSLL